MTGVSTEWWRNAVGYEVYLRSFADGDDDGIGDLPGLIDRLDHLAWLGVDVVWITPFYPSPMADYGYDVADYTGVHPLFGTLDDFDRLIAKADRLGLRVVIDIVPNHTSDHHPWFQAARSSPDDPRRDYYHWRDGTPGGAPFNNWVGYFGGPAWSYDDQAGQQYLHLFLPEQPDLNWANPAVIEEFDAILRFWLDRGVSGFRIDVAQAMGKDHALRDNPVNFPTDGTEDRWTQWASLDHRHDILQPETLDVFRRWRAIAADYDAVLIGELRDLETIEAALTISETGHLALATLHTNSAIQSINRIIDVFPPHQQAQVRAQLSFVLEGGHQSAAYPACVGTRSRVGL